MYVYCNQNYLGHLPDIRPRELYLEKLEDSNLHLTLLEQPTFVNKLVHHPGNENKECKELEWEHATIPQL